MGNHVCSLNILSIHKSIHKCPIGFSYTCFSIEFHRSIDRMESLKKEKKKKRKKERKKKYATFHFFQTIPEFVPLSLVISTIS